MGYEGYKRLFERIGTTPHQSCVVLTSREKPAEIKSLEGSRTPVRSLHLTGLDEETGKQILSEKRLTGDASARRQLIDTYSGNPLALKIVAETIRELFASEIAPFLAEGHLIFQGIRALLAEQFARLPFLAKSILFWLAIVREPVDVTTLLVRFVTPVPRLQVLEALEDLRRRSLVEHGPQCSQFTLQSVVMEYITDTLVQQMAREVQRREPDHLLAYALSLASAKEYIRQTQKRLLVAPVLLHLGAAQYRKGVVEQQLLSCLDLLRSYDLGGQGYGPTNAILLLQHLRGHLQQADLSQLTLREASLQGIEMQDASLRGSHMHASTFTEVLSIVAAVAVSSNGAYWAAGSDTGEVRVFLEESSIPSLVLQTRSSVNIIAFSPDGQVLATGGWDHLIKIWHLEHEMRLATLEGHSDMIQGIMFSPDGTWLATSSLDGTVRIWDLTSFEMLHLLHANEGGTSRVAWSPDGQILANGEEDGIGLWDPHNGKALRKLRDVGNTIYGLAFSPDSQLLVSGGTDKLVKIWDVSTGRCLQSLLGHTATVIVAQWSPDGRLLASGSSDSTVRIWQANPAVAQHVLLGHSDTVQSIAFNADGTKLFSGSADRSVRVWDTASGSCVRLLQGYTLACSSVAWNPDGDRVAAATSDSLITLWHPVEERSLQVLQRHTQAVNSVIWSPDGQMLASGSDDQTICLWKSNTGVCFSVLYGHTSAVRALAWHPDGSMLASGGYFDQTVGVWDIRKEICCWVGEEHIAAVMTLAWSPDGTCLASGGDITVRLWNAEDGTLLKLFKGDQGRVSDIAWSPDGTQLASCGEAAGVLLWDVASGKCLRTVLESVPGLRRRTIAWSPKGDRLLVSGRDGVIYWVETEGWICLTIRKEHQSTIRSIRISPDGRNAASADNNGVIIIWDIEQAIPLHVLRPDRPYERLDISGIQGITEAQKLTLRALGAVEL